MLLSSFGVALRKDVHLTLYPLSEYTRETRFIQIDRGEIAKTKNRNEHWPGRQSPSACCAPEVDPTMLVKRPDMVEHNLQPQCWRSIGGKILGAGWTSIRAQWASPGQWETLSQTKQDGPHLRIYTLNWLLPSTCTCSHTHMWTYTHTNTCI